MLSIQTNVNSMNAQENLRLTNLFQGRTIARLTSGFRINESGDDAAGLAVANKFRSDVAELAQGIRNANDGLSTLQIIDGGLNNISKILDRLKTLATQSASVTFTGNRATLNNEYQSLLTEIDRQANNVGLGAGASTTTSAKNNKAIAVYVGGGADLMANSKVTVDLSQSADKVNSSSLGLSSTQINGAAGAAISGNDNDLITQSTGLLDAATAYQDFTIRTASSTVTARITGAIGGITATQAVASLNSQIASTGVSAYIDQNDGLLKFTSASTAFSVDADAAVGATAGREIADAGAAYAQHLYHVDGDGAFEAITADANNQTLTIKVGSTSTAIILNNGQNITSVVTEINAAVNAVGVYAVLDAEGDDFNLYSTGTFQYQVTKPAAQGWAAAAVAVDTDATAPAAGSTSPETAAQTAITAINDAVTKLGAVQGKVGTGQNQLTYAIQLAQSQVTSFSAAESRIRDADVAQEAANLTKAQVLQQASLAALAQANSAPQAVLSLLRG